MERDLLLYPRGLLATFTAGIPIHLQIKYKVSPESLFRAATVMEPTGSLSTGDPNDDQNQPLPACMAVFPYRRLVLLGAIDRQTQDALKVRHLLKTIQSTPPRPDGKERSAEITQPEVNAYIAWRLAHEKNTVIDAMTVDLLDDNRVAGKIRFDAARLNLDALLGEALNFDFQGIVTTRNREARLELISVSLNGQPVQPRCWTT